jgi:hypothetical protein
MSTMFEVVPDSPLAIFAGPNTRTSNRALANRLAAQEAEHFGIPHHVEEVHPS